MLFATASLARRIEQAEASLIAGFGRAAARTRPGGEIYIEMIGGGTAVAAGPLAPMSKIAGLGFEPIDEAAIERVEQAFEQRGTPVRVEIASLADPAVGALLTRRGYVLSGFENVLGLALDSSAPIDRTGWPAAVAVARITPDESAIWSDTVVTGFMSPDTFDAPPSDEVVDRAALDDLFENIDEVDGLVRYLARRDGEPAGWRQPANLERRRAAVRRRDAPAASTARRADDPPARAAGRGAARRLRRGGRDDAAGIELAAEHRAPGIRADVCARRPDQGG